MNIMMAAALADGTTTIENAAKEPHIVDLANFLNSMGADIKGAGTDSIRIRGVEKLTGGTYCIIPDQIEAGTYMAAVAAAGGRLLIRNVIPKHMDCISAKLTEMGVTVEEEDDTLLVTPVPARSSAPMSKPSPIPASPRICSPRSPWCCPWPRVPAWSPRGYTAPTDSNTWMSCSRMGAQVQVDGRVAVIEGVDHLNGAPVQACDLRAGAALVIAGLAAQGVTQLSQCAVSSSAAMRTWWASSAPWARTSGWRRSPNPRRLRHTSADIAIPASAATRGGRRIFSAR